MLERLVHGTAHRDRLEALAFGVGEIAEDLDFGGDELDVPALRVLAQLDVVQVRVGYPGAAPSEVEQGILRPVEEAVRSVEGIREHCERLSDRYQTPFHMAGYAMVEALRDQNIEKVALNACYHRASWYEGTVGFLREAGFDVVWAGNFFDQGWFPSQQAVDDCIWCFDEELLWKSFDFVAEQAPEVDAYLINGMSNYRRPSDGLARRPLHHVAALEKRLGKPVIGHDIALYWRIFKTLGIRPERAEGQLLSSLEAADHA